MKNLNKSATATFKKLIEGLEYNTETEGKKSHRRIENGSWMPLSIEIIDKTPNGQKIIMLCHYGEMNGDLMADPEMNFLVSPSGETVCPIYFRNDYTTLAGFGGEKPSVFDNDENYTRYTINKAMQADQTQFANVWMKNIKEQGFLEKLQPLLA